MTKRQTKVLSAVFGFLLFFEGSFSSLSAQSDEARIVESYVAYVGPRDEFNSRGERLYYLHQMIEQDRANVHAFRKPDSEDRLDSIFHSFQMRMRLSEYLLGTGAVGPFPKGLPDHSRAYHVQISRDVSGVLQARLTLLEDFVGLSKRPYACTRIEIDQGICDGLQF